MDYLEQRRKLRQMVQERLDYGRDYTDEEVERLMKFSWNRKIWNCVLWNYGDDCVRNCLIP